MGQEISALAADLALPLQSAGKLCCICAICRREVRIMNASGFCSLAIMRHRNLRMCVTHMQ
jgi:hypothetical protein